MQVERDGLGDVGECTGRRGMSTVSVWKLSRSAYLVGSSVYLSTAIKPQMHSAFALCGVSFSLSVRITGTV